MADRGSLIGDNRFHGHQQDIPGLLIQVVKRTLREPFGDNGFNRYFGLASSHFMTIGNPNICIWPGRFRHLQTVVARYTTLLC